MDHARLARETVEKLAPYLEELMDRQIPNPDAPQKLVEAFRLWKLIYPKIALRSGVIQAVKNTIADNSAGNRAALAQQLIQIYRTNEHFASQVREVIRRQASYPTEEDPPPPPPQDYFSQASTGGKEFSAEQVSCQICGTKDETLRLVSYPYVVSVIIMTFRRVFQGVYCAKHANRYFFLAIFITLTIGWLGIPFGFLFTPITLFTLLTVDKKLRPANAKLLLEIVKAKLEAGEREAAAIYLKESLWLDDTEQARAEAQKLADILKPPAQPDYLFQLVTLLFTYLTVWVMGLLIGLIDGMVSLPLAQFSENVPILAVIFSYLPLVMLLIFGAFIATRLSLETTQKVALRSRWGGRLLAVLLSVAAAYATLTGKFLFDAQMNISSITPNMLKRLFYYGSLLFNGGWQMLSQVLAGQEATSAVFVILVLLGAVLFLWVNQDYITRTVRWQVTIDKLSGLTRHNSGSLVVVISTLLTIAFWLIFSSIFYLAG